jgi:hypothetical protein
MNLCFAGACVCKVVMVNELFAKSSQPMGCGRASRQFRRESKEKKPGADAGLLCHLSTTSIIRAGRKLLCQLLFRWK